MAVTHFDLTPTRDVSGPAAYVTIICATGGDPVTHIRTDDVSKVTCKKCLKNWAKRFPQTEGQA